MPRENSAGAVVFRREDNEIYYLLLHYSGDHWDFPKGHIEKGENEIETVKREIEEETGIKDIKIIKGFRESIKYFFRQYKEKISLEDRNKNRIPWVFKTVVFYLAETKTKKIKISPEHIGYQWLSYKKALKQLTYKNSKELFKKANIFILSRNY